MFGNSAKYFFRRLLASIKYIDKKNTFRRCFLYEEEGTIKEKIKTLEKENQTLFSNILLYLIV